MELFRLSCTHLVDKDNTRNNLSYTLIDVTFHNSVDFFTKFLRNFSPPAPNQTAHDAHNILSALWSGIGRVQVPEGYILNNHFSFVHIALREGYVCFRFEIV